MVEKVMDNEKLIKSKNLKDSLVQTKITGLAHPSAPISIQKLEGHMADLEDSGAKDVPVMEKPEKKVTGTGGSSFGSAGGN